MTRESNTTWYNSLELTNELNNLVESRNSVKSITDDEEFIGMIDFDMYQDNVMDKVQEMFLCLQRIEYDWFVVEISDKDGIKQHITAFVIQKKEILKVFKDLLVSFDVECENKEYWDYLPVFLSEFSPMKFFEFLEAYYKFF